MPSTVATWNIFEFEAAGPADGNPFIDVTFAADFSKGSRSVPVPGFYDGDGTYRVRFMPDTEGELELPHPLQPSGARRRDRRLRLHAARAGGTTGPVQVSGRHHFAYADGTPYFPFGTTCYAWTHQPLDDAGRDARDPRQGALQQDPHVRLPQGLYLQRPTSRCTTSTRAEPTARSTSTVRTRWRSATSRPRWPR